jgi:hypothetical protein
MPTLSSQNSWGHFKKWWTTSQNNYSPDPLLQPEFNSIFSRAMTIGNSILVVINLPSISVNTFKVHDSKTRHKTQVTNTIELVNLFPSLTFIYKSEINRYDFFK